MGRPRARNAGGFIQIYTAPQDKQWLEDATKLVSIDSLAPEFGGAFEGPVELEIVAVFERPKHMLCQHKRQPCSCPPEKLQAQRIVHTQKPDWDNVAKIVCDVLQRSAVLTDDSQVVRGSTTKLWAAVGENPHVLVTIKEYEHVFV
jgi:Holliday junction resolvase RusA-like endonuclease